jgi:hypothetical protein
VPDFGSYLHPRLRERIASWHADPELSRLASKLQSHSEQRMFLDAVAEAVIAQYLLDRGCTLRTEVQTPTGKTCDFEIHCDNQLFYLHVKRVNNERPQQRHLTISSRLRSLERVPRPYLVSIRWQAGLTDAQMQEFVTRAGDFIMHARVGDELVVHDSRNIELGGVLIVAPWDGTHVNLTIGLPTGFVDEAPRILRLMQRAHNQFMPRAVNVILVSTSHAEDVADFEAALLGAHIERWDRHPPVGSRIAHGRADDGFWSGTLHPDSLAAGWFRFAPDEASPQCRLWLRSPVTLPPASVATLTQLFHAVD